jgi:hypothetical protein
MVEKIVTNGRKINEKSRKKLYKIVGKILRKMAGKCKMGGIIKNGGKI